MTNIYYNTVCATFIFYKPTKLIIILIITKVNRIVKNDLSE